MTAASTEAALVERSIDRYRRAHRRYERRHPEIFNAVEQARLREALDRGRRAIATASSPARALDFGCGAGNLTAHLLALGLDVTAADVSPEFLDAVRRRFAGRALATLRLNGVDLAGVPDASFDLVAAYSVLHHVPDYLGVLAELVRVLRPGGVLHLDHEANEQFWGPHGSGHAFREELARLARERRGLWNPQRHRWQRVLQPTWWALRLRPEWVFGREGDIHVWPDDHIEWDRIEAVLLELGCEIVHREDYLNFHAGYPRDVWARWRDAGCTDMRALTVRRPAA
jgi:SAM-dependent methyltransferase